LLTSRRAPSLASFPVDPLPADVFKATQIELAQDLITKEQEIELLISTLPGLENSEQDQERYIRELEEEIKAAEIQRQAAIKERQDTISKLNNVLQGVRRHV
jgi:mediator of RNA polymerase II transcription subunit 21